MKKNIFIGILVVIIITLVIFLGIQSKKIPTQNPATVNIAKTSQTTILPIDLVTSLDLTNSPVFTGKAFPFSFSYSGTIEGDSQENLSGDNHTVWEGLGITLAPRSTNLYPVINVFAWKAEGTEPQTADIYCSNVKAGPTFQISDTYIESMTINGYPACYSVQNLNKEKATISHSFTISNKGYFVQFNFQQQTNWVMSNEGGDIYTQRNYAKFLPEYKAIVYSIKIP
jgi:hypothetical protein